MDCPLPTLRIDEMLPGCPVNCCTRGAAQQATPIAIPATSHR
jgi:hypothetical protein